MISVYCLGCFSHSWMRCRYYVISSSLRELLKVSFPPVSRLLSQKAKCRESPAVISLHQQCPSFPSYFPLSPPFHLPQEYSKKWQREPLKAWPTPVQEMCKGTNRIVPDRDWEKHTGARCAQLDVCVCVLPSSCRDRLCLWHLIPTHCKRLIL